MHKRGWTYFRLSGRIGDEEISGTRRLPFVEAARAQYGAWLKLKVGGRLDLADNGQEARLYDGGRFAARYAGGSFFVGFPRPWMGLHTIDTVRRDAAANRIWFDAKAEGQGNVVEVVLTREESELSYAVNMDKDIVEKIGIVSKDGREGELVFSYLDEVDGIEDEFVAPSWRDSSERRSETPRTLWLMNLVDGKW